MNRHFGARTFQSAPLDLSPWGADKIVRAPFGAGSCHAPLLLLFSLAILLLPGSSSLHAQVTATNRLGTATNTVSQRQGLPGGEANQTNRLNVPTNNIRQSTSSIQPPVPPVRPPIFQVPPGQVRPNVQIWPAVPGTLPAQFPPPATPGQPAPGTDPLLNLMLQQPSIDIESPAMVLTEFDPTVIPVGGRSTYRIVITALNEVITAPDKLPTPAALNVTPGGRSQSFFAMGNKLQPRTTINYRVTAPAPGNYTIPPFSVTVAGKLIQLPAARLQVVPPGTMPTPPIPKLIVKLPAEDIYVGQSVPIQVMMTDPDGNSVRGLTRVEVTSEGFMVDTTFYRQRRDTVTLDGKTVPALAQEMFLTPLKAGEVKLVAQAQAILGLPTSAQAAQLPGYFPLVDADPVMVTVKRLPTEGELPGFTGAIGMFTLDQPRLSTNQVRAGEPVTLTVTFKGQGNLARLIPPKLDGLWDWQTFEPTSDAAMAQIIQQRGFATFNYTLIPLSDRITSTPRIPFSFFDPSKRAFTDLTVPPVPIQVLSAPGGVSRLPPAGAAALPASSDEDRDTEGRNLVMNGLSETPGVIVSTLVPIQQRTWFMVFQFVPAVALGLLWLWDRRRRFLAAHPEVRLKRRARQGLRRYQRRLRQAAAARDTGGFVKAAVNAMREACAPHEAANPEALVCGDVLRTLSAHEREGKSVEVVRRLFSASDLIQFGGRVPEGEHLLGLRSDLERLLAQLRARL